MILQSSQGNFNHGAFLSGANRLDKEEALRLYPRYQPAGYFQQLAEEVAADRGIKLTNEHAPMTLSDFLDSGSIRARCGFVP